MYREYDLFEKFPDGSSLWRASVLGLEGACIYMQELSRKSGNEFYAIDVMRGKTIHFGSDQVGLHLLVNRRGVRKSKTATA
jgi:hypothetical protein